jgi:hypothetical protein
MTPTTTAMTATVEAASNTGRFYPDREDHNARFANRIDKPSWLLGGASETASERPRDVRPAMLLLSLPLECASSPDEPASTPHLLGGSEESPRAARRGVRSLAARLPAELRGAPCAAHVFRDGR